MATVTFTLAILAQLLLAAGVLPVTMAWGGTQPMLTAPLRAASVAAAVVLALTLLVVRRRAMNPTPGRALRFGSFAIAGFLSLNALGNFASGSLGEALVFGPLALVAAGACWVVAASRGPG